MELYVVKSGDTLYDIAQAYALPLDLLLQINQLEAPDQLVVGQTLLLLQPTKTHQVQPGDSLESIAQAYHTQPRPLLRNNPQLQGKTQLTPGQTLVISYKDQQDTPAFVLGYAYPNIPLDLLQTVLPYLSAVAPFTHRFDTQGKIYPLSDGAISQAGSALGISTFFHLASVNETGAFSTALSNAILASPEKQQDLIQEICRILRQKDYQGVDVDFELIDPQYAQAYVEFLGALKKALGDFPLFVAVAPKINAKQPGIFYEGHQYQGIGQVADGVLLMTYEWGYPEGDPMAIAPISGVRQVLDYAITEIPPEKLLLGVPTYGYNWKVPRKMGEKATSLPCPQAVALAREFGAEIFFDQSAQAPYFHYTDHQEQSHCVWFEDARSIQTKLKLVAEYGLKGLGYWNLDRPFPQNWGVLNQLLRPLQQIQP